MGMAFPDADNPQYVDLSKDGMSLMFIPARERLESLGLKYVADELEAHGPYPDWDGAPLWPLERYPHGGRTLETESGQDRVTGAA